ncbi:hypothetical protein [Klebsiella pneumoniae]|uniref:hypothetical protein n=1 Tax=Klebsiella pneumoniae TaxID=573 RepID=UPI002D7D447B|nr:hypothetical protein [Klebsiella pneumoniae]HCF8965756.1 hypothetical protein [Klebsiella pneumoniae]
MSKSTITRERARQIFLGNGPETSASEERELARMALAAMDSEPVAWTWHYREQWHVTNDERRAEFVATDGDVAVLPLYLHAQPAPVVPENCVTVEHRRVIEMLLNVCGAAFELADDSCQQDVDGEDCHVVPDDAFQKLSDALDEIENTLPTEDIDRPDVFLAWSAIPKAALKSLLQAGNSPVTGIDLASGPDRTVEVRYVAPPGYVMVPKEPTKQMILAGQEELESCIDNGFDSDIDGNRYDYTDIVPDAPHRVFMAMLAAAPQEVKSES